MTAVSNFQPVDTAGNGLLQFGPEHWFILPSVDVTMRASLYLRELHGDVTDSFFERFRLDAMTKPPAPVPNHFMILLFVLEALMLFICVAFSKQPVNHDAAIILWAAEQIVAGKLPYVDYVELSLPLTHYLHVVPVVIARSLGFSLPKVFNYLTLVFVLLLAIALIRLSYRYLKTEISPYFFPLLLVFFSLWIFADGGFGQREHYFFISTSVFLLMRIGAHEQTRIGSWDGIVFGVLCTPFILVKPHFLVIVAGVEFCLWLRSRSLSAILTPEIYILVFSSLLYVLYFLFIPDAARDAFFGEFLPLVLGNYRIYDTSLLKLIYFGLNIVVIPGLLVSLWMLTKTKSMGEAAFFSAAFFSILMFLLQHKGWSYHLYPALGFFIFGFAIRFFSLFGITGYTAQLKMIRLPVWTLFVFFLSSLFLSCVSFYMGPKRRQRLIPLAQLIQSYSKESERIFLITTRVYPAYPGILYARRNNVARYAQAFPIAFFSNNRNLKLFESRFLEQLGDDINQRKPALILIETKECGPCPPEFNVIGYLKKNNWIKRFLKEYEFVDNREGFAVYRKGN